MYESEKWKWSHSVVSDSSQPYGLQPTRLLHPWDFPGKSTGVGCCCLLLRVSKFSGPFLTFSLLNLATALESVTPTSLIDFLSSFAGHHSLFAFHLLSYSHHPLLSYWFLRGGGLEEQPTPEARGATRGVTQSRGCAGAGGPRGAIPHWSSRRAAVRRYPRPR